MQVPQTTPLKSLLFKKKLCFKGETLFCVSKAKRFQNVDVLTISRPQDLLVSNTYQCDEFHRGIICCRWSLSDIHQVTFYQRKILANALSLLMRNDDVCIGFHILKEKWQMLFVSWCHSYHTVGPFFPLSEFRLIGLNYNLWVNLLTITCG